MNIEELQKQAREEFNEEVLVNMAIDDVVSDVQEKWIMEFLDTIIANTVAETKKQCLECAPDGYDSITIKQIREIKELSETNHKNGHIVWKTVMHKKASELGLTDKEILQINRIDNINQI